MGKTTNVNQMKSINMQAVKVLRTAANINEQYCISYDEPLDEEALALFTSKGTYKPIFHVKKKEAKQAKQRLSVVKISHGKKVIYRQYAGRGISFGKDIESSKCVGLSPNSWQQLCLDDSDNKNVLVTKGWWFPFYWNHSNSATRVSFRIGIMGLALAIIGIVVSVII